MEEYKIEKELVFNKMHYEPHEKQKLIHKGKVRFKVLACGRRFGKSLGAAMEAIYLLMHPETRGWVVAPTYLLADKVFREIFYYMNKYTPELIESQSAHKMHLKTVMGSEVWGKSADTPVGLLGEGLDWLIVDECAQIKEIVWHQYLRPTLTDRQGTGIFISTPAGRNWFYELFIRGQDPLETQYVSYNFPTLDNPFIEPSEVDEAKTQVPQRYFRQEYMAEFLTDEGAVFRNIRNCIGGELIGAIKGQQYVMGVDLAKYEDFTVIVVINVQTKQVVHFERFNKIDWTLQEERIMKISQDYNNAIMYIDSTGVGDPIYEKLVRNGVNAIGYSFNSATKKHLIDRLSIALEKEDIHFPEIPELINELLIYEYVKSPAGNLRANAPQGYHDDCVIALGLANLGLDHGVVEPAHLSRRVTRR